MKRGFRIFSAIAIFILLINFSVAARLPTVSSDADTWGDILNAFLRISHEEGGFLRNINNTVEGITNVDGNLTASGNVSTPLICLNGACQSAWGADSLWTNVSGTATFVGNVNVTQGVYINGYFINSSNYINPIVESGNNSNGSYIKYIDGTMIAWGNVSGTTVNLFSGWYYTNQITVTFPSAFASAPNFVYTTEEMTSDSLNVPMGASYNTLNTIGVRIYLGSSANSQVIKGHWRAIGKWTNTPYNTSTITVGGGIPSGAIVPFNRTSCPVGWTLADGSSGTPDLRGIFIRGSGTNSILKYANGTYFSATQGNYKNDSLQGHYHNLTSIGSWNVGSYGTSRADYVVQNSDFAFASDLLTDGTNGVPRTGAETSPAYYSTIYCVKTTEDSDSSNTIWATSGNNVLLNNASQSLNLNSTNTTYYSPRSGEDSIGTLHYISDANRNTTTFMAQGSPVSGTTYTSPDVTTRVPNGAKAVLIRWWVSKGATAGSDWYWAGFSAGNGYLAGDAATIATGAELTYVNTFHHEMITIPIDSSNKFKVFWTSTGTFSSFNANIIGYYI